jgi:hypothetical protein
VSPEEAVRICAFTSACCPAQKFDEFTPDAWGLILADIRFEDAKLAVVEIKKSSTWVDPSDIIREVKRIRAKRISEYGPMTPPADLDPDDTGAYRDWWVNTQRAIGDGVLKPLELEQKPDPEGQQAVKELISGAFKGVRRSS